jgi:hypothetical protein
MLVGASALLSALGGGVLWTRPLWMDELVTLFLTSHRSFRDMIANVSAGGDWAPPLLHAVVWSVRRVTGDVTPVLLRTMALSCVLLGLLFVYAALRRRFGRVASGAGTLALLGSPLLIEHAFEGRGYGPWLLFAAAYAWSLGIDAGQHRSRRRDVAQAVCSIFLTTIHWFGVVCLGLMAAAVVAARGRRWRDGVRSVAPSAVGVIALLVCLPMAFSQRASASGLLWVVKLEMTQVLSFARLFWLALPTILAIILIFREGTRADGAWPGIRERIREALLDPTMVALVSLALMPIVLVVISIVLQPSMVPRYSLVAVLAWAPLVAVAVDTLPRDGRAAVVLVLAFAMQIAVARTINEKRGFATEILRNQAAFEEAKLLGLPVVFQKQMLIFPVAGPQRSPHMLARFLDVPDSTLLALYPADRFEWLRKDFRIQREQMRLHARVYGFPILATQADLDTTPRFVVLATDLQLPGGYKRADKWGTALFPHHRVERLSESVILFERRRPVSAVDGVARPRT